MPGEFVVDKTGLQQIVQGLQAIKHHARLAEQTADAFIPLSGDEETHKMLEAIKISAATIDRYATALYHKTAKEALEA